MPCYHPAKIPHPEHPRSSGVRLAVPCGRCIGCLLQRGRDWTVRCIHESRLHDFSWFVTFTYDDDHIYVPGDFPSLNPIDMTLFWKRLRKKFRRKIRYFYCGEYGDITARPHYHAIIFGLDLDDLKEYSVRNGNKLYTSETLSSLWGLGQVIIGEVATDSIAYTAGYCLKKLYGPDATKYYAMRQTVPPFVRMSRRPGIGSEYFHRFKSDFDHDYALLDSTFKSKLPRFYDKLLAELGDLDWRKKDRKDRAWSQLSEQSRKRLATREAVARAHYGRKPDNFF